METHSGYGRETDAEVPQPGAAADRLGEVFYNKLQINPQQGVAAAPISGGGGGGGGGGGSGVAVEDGSSELQPLTLAPGQSASRLNPSVGRHAAADPAGAAVADPRHVTGYGLSYGQYDSGAAAFTAATAGAGADELNMASGGGGGGGGFSGGGGGGDEAVELEAARRGLGLGGPDVTGGPGAVGAEDEAATRGRALLRQRQRQRADLAELSREAGGATGSDFARGGVDDIHGERAAHAAAAATANTPLTAADLGGGVTGERRLRPEDFCELGNEAGGAVEGVQAAAAAATGRGAGEAVAGPPGGRGLGGVGGALRPSEGGMSEEVVMMGGGGGGGEGGGGGGGSGGAAGGAGGGGGGGGSGPQARAGLRLSAGDYQF
ncbi:hypothetical protein HYH02_011297 [Chlamydomonas schloesseri]|uniref:Uncharacterized protein n=1 Tax=Chlamydomonas schloesseri TaxID=2026947 RepID=A0A835T1C5_9CHLO|nr:hypothetical protein HYH02_011297 [Chlamydomonas schloesseri]|eukprot:KAG2437034.1 hypothetical protein HYH02_011297 [Chlamydomonas schloesseri]